MVSKSIKTHLNPCTVIFKMNSYTCKLLISFLTILSAFLYYIDQRLRKEISILERPSDYNNYDVLDFKAKPKSFMTFPKMITYSPSENIADQARRLYELDFYCSKTTVQVSSSSPLKTIDLRIFLHEYFKAVKNNYIITRNNYNNNNNFLKDNCLTEVDFNNLIVFGGMYALAQITNAYIEINLLDFVLSKDPTLCPDDLKVIDKNQYDIYDEIRRAPKYHANSNKFYHLQESDYPFQRNGHFPVINYPLNVALKRILVDPYVKVRKNLFIGIGKYLDNYHQNYKVGLISINVSISFLNLWRKHSICSSSSCSHFWKALLKLKHAYKFMKIFFLITGYQAFPTGGFARFPELEIFDENVDEFNPLFADRFKINLFNFRTIERIDAELEKIKYSH